MLNHFKSSLCAAIVLPLLLHVSSALGAHATGHADVHVAAAGRHQRNAYPETRHKPGVAVHPGRYHLRAAATSVLLGDTVVEWQYDSLAGGEAEAFRFKAVASGLASAVHVYTSASTSARTLIAGLYSAAPGRPGALVSTGSASPEPGTWTSVAIAPVELVLGRSYWLAILGTGGRVRYRDRAGGPCASEMSAGHHLRALPSSWSTGATYSDCPVSAYVTPAQLSLVAGSAALGSPLSDPTAILEEPVAPAPAAPVATALPVISGSADEGDTLRASEGSWSGSPTSYAYRWEDCNGAGQACLEIGGATSSSYTLVKGDVGHTVRVVVTATNAAGSTKASSEPTSTVEAAKPPKVVVLPAVSGVAEEGLKLSASEGSWSGSPTSYAYHWEDCNLAGEACLEIGGATSSSYKLVKGDVGHTVRVVVTATNAAGSTKASSEPTAKVVAAGSAGPQVFVSQAGAGNESGEGGCADAHRLAWLNSEGNWGSGAGRVAPGMTVDLCGTLTQAIDTGGSGEPGKPITIEFLSGAKIEMAGNGCPGEGCIDLKGGSEYITITSAAGYKGQIENTERSYAKEKEEGPATKGVLALGCKHCNIENLEIGPLYIAEKGDVVADNNITGIAVYNEDGEPEYDTIRNNYLHDQGWSVEIQNGANSGHIYVEHNTFYHLTHGLALGAKITGASSIGEETFAHNRFYGDTNWEDPIVDDTNHVDGVHCYVGNESPLAHYTGLYIYDNYITTGGTDTTGPIFLEGSQARNPCSDKTSNVWIFNNVLTGNTCCGLAGAFAGEDHTYDNTMIGEGPEHLSETGDHEICEKFSSDTQDGRALTVGNRTFKNNVVSSCGVLMSAERFLVASNGMEHNLWANGDDTNEVFACDHGEVETDEEDKEAFPTGEFGKWETCMEQPETESRYVSNAKLRLTGEAQAPLGEPESGSEAIGHGKNLTSLCAQTPEEALCENIKGEARPNSGSWNVGAY